MNVHAKQAVVRHLPEPLHQQRLYLVKLFLAQQRFSLLFETTHVFIQTAVVLFNHLPIRPNHAFPLDAIPLHIWCWALCWTKPIRIHGGRDADCMQLDHVIELGRKLDLEATFSVRRVCVDTQQHFGTRICVVCRQDFVVTSAVGNLWDGDKLRCGTPCWHPRLLPLAAVCHLHSNWLWRILDCQRPQHSCGCRTTYRLHHCWRCYFLHHCWRCYFLRCYFLRRYFLRCYFLRRCWRYYFLRRLLHRPLHQRSLWVFGFWFFCRSL